LLVKTSTDRLKGQSIVADPLKHLIHDSGLLEQDLILSVAAYLRIPDISVPVGGFADGVDPALSGGMKLAPTTPLHDVRPLIFGEHALYL